MSGKPTLSTRVSALEAAQGKSPNALALISHIPLTSIVHIIVAVVGAVLLIVNGHVSTDFLTYVGIIEGGNVGVGLARAADATSKP